MQTIFRKKKKKKLMPEKLTVLDPGSAPEEWLAQILQRL